MFDHELQNGIPGDDEDDPVVQRIPVHLSKGSAGQLFMFEYSRNTVINNFEENRIVQSRIKPNQQKVELHLQLDKESKNFNSDLARKLAAKTPKTGIETSKHLIETQILTSSTAAPKNASRYAIGVAQKDGIHLNPLTGIVFLKPSYDYLDAAAKKQDLTAKEGEGSSIAASAKPVTIKFARQNAKRMKMSQAASLAGQQKLKEEEPWCEVDFFSASHIKSIREKERLNCEQVDNNISGIFCDDSEAYLLGLCPPEVNCAFEKETAAAEELSKLPLSEQIRERMKQVNVIKFSRLKHLLGNNWEDREVVSGLVRVADVIKGNWVLKSSLLFDKDFLSSRGVSADRLISARDKILLAISNQDSVGCKQLAKMTRIPAEDVIDILLPLAYKVSKVGWKFKLEKDDQFIKNFAEVVDQQRKIFETRVKNQEKKEEEEAADAKAKKPKNQARQRKNSTRSRKDSQCSDIG